MSEDYEFRVVVRDRKVLRLRSPNKRETLSVYGEETLYGRRREIMIDGEVELWIVFPRRRNFGLDPDDVLNVHWDKIATLYHRGEDGIERPLFPRETPG